MDKQYSNHYYVSLLIQIINRESKEALAHDGLPIDVRRNLKNMLTEASKAQEALREKGQQCTSQ